MTAQRSTIGPAPASAGAGPTVFFIYWPADHAGARLHRARWRAPGPLAESPGRPRDGVKPEFIHARRGVTGRGVLGLGDPVGAISQIDNRDGKLALKDL